MKNYHTEVRPTYGNPRAMFIGQPGEYGSWLDLPNHAAYSVVEAISSMKAAGRTSARAFFPGGAVEVEQESGGASMLLRGSARCSEDMGIVRIKDSELAFVLVRMLDLAG